MRRHVPLALAAALALAGSSVPAAAAPVGTRAASGLTVGAFTFNLDREEGTATLTGWSGKRRTTIDIPATIRVGEEQFRVTTIGHGAFAGPVSYVFPDPSPVPATSVSIPEGVEEIEDYAFYGNRITSFVIPSTVSRIGVRSLNQDVILEIGSRYSLRTVTFRGDAPDMDDLGDFVCTPGGCSYNGKPPLGIGNGLIVYYEPGAKGFSSPLWSGYLAAPRGTVPVPAKYDGAVGDLMVHPEPDLVAGAKVTAKFRAWAVGGKLTPKPTRTTFRWQLRNDDGRWSTIGTGRTVRLPAGSTGKLVRILTIVKGPGSRQAVLQLSGVWTVLPELARRPKPTIALPTGAKKAVVGTRLAATGATAKRWAPKADSVAYQWYRNGKAIKKNGSKRTYKVTAADRGARLTVRATASKKGYASASRTSASVTVPKK